MGSEQSRGPTRHTGIYSTSPDIHFTIHAQYPFTRLPTFGVRCAYFPTPVPAAALLPIVPAERDYSTERPVGDETFEIFRRLYSYDKMPLLAKTESVNDSNELWRKETVSYAAAYGGERIPAYLFLNEKRETAVSDCALGPRGICAVHSE